MRKMLDSVDFFAFCLISFLGSLDISNQKHMPKNRETGGQDHSLEVDAGDRRETVNGIEIEFLWDDYHERYALSFPQIEADNEVLQEIGVDGQKILLSLNPDTAKKVFDFAVLVAQTVRDAKPEDVWLKVWEFCKAPFGVEEKKAA